MNEPNVRVVFDHIEKVTPEGITLKSGERLSLDVIVCATGFDLSWKPRFPIIGRNKSSMHDQFKERPTGYLGIAVQNMPNYFGMFKKGGKLHLKSYSMIVFLRTDLFNSVLRPQLATSTRFDPAFV